MKLRKSAPLLDLEDALSSSAGSSACFSDIEEGEETEWETDDKGEQQQEKGEDAERDHQTSAAGLHSHPLLRRGEQGAQVTHSSKYTSLHMLSGQSRTPGPHA